MLRFFSVEKGHDLNTVGRFFFWQETCLPKSFRGGLHLCFLETMWLEVDENKNPSKVLGERTAKKS